MKIIQTIAILLLILPVLCEADDKPPQVISDSWTMVPKAGQHKEFEEAVKKHMAYRKEKGDPRHWDVYVPVLGDDLNRYIVRSCCQPWDEQDTYRQWSMENLGNHFNETVDPYVEKYIHNFSEIDMANSNWGEDVDASYVGVTYRTVKSGKGQQANAAIAAMSKLAKESGWPYNWSWSTPVAGEYRIGLAVPYKNFASMQPPEENFYQFAQKHMTVKDAEKMFKEFNDAFSNSHYNIYRHDKTLSMQSKKK